MTKSVDQLKMCPLPEKMFWVVSFHHAISVDGAVHLSLHRSGFWGPRRVTSSCAVTRTNRLSAQEIAKEVMEESWQLWNKYTAVPAEEAVRTKADEVMRILDSPQVKVEFKNY